MRRHVANNKGDSGTPQEEICGASHIFPK